MKRKRSNGATLVELLVVTTIFLMMMTVILSFYGQATKVSQRQDRDSTQFRRAVTALDKMEMLLGTSKVYQVTDHMVVFSELGSPAVKNGFPNFDSQASTLQVVDQKIVHRRGDIDNVVANLDKYEQVNFQYARWKDAPPGNELLSIDWVFDAPEDNLDFLHNRMIPMELY